MRKGIDEEAPMTEMMKPYADPTEQLVTEIFVRDISGHIRRATSEKAVKLSIPEFQRYLSFDGSVDNFNTFRLIV